jgi:hypothetical protein
VRQGPAAAQGGGQPRLDRVQLWRSVLNERAVNRDADSQAVLDALAVEQQVWVAAATENIKEVLSKGEPMRMEGAIVRLAKEGKIDEPFLLLLEANADQARAVGAIGLAELMTKLRKRAMAEKDKQSASKEIIREPDLNKREELLTDVFTSKETLIVSYAPWDISMLQRRSYLALLAHAPYFTNAIFLSLAK